MTEYKLGKLPAREGAVKFKMSDFFDLTHLPRPPLVFGIGAKYPWKLLANDKYGDCVWAGSANLELYWHLQNKRPIEFMDENVVSDYAAATGFNPADPNTDRGTDMEDAAKYWRHTGIIDSTGKRNKIDAYVSIPKHRFDEIAVAAYLFEGIGLGIMFPQSAHEQFTKQVPWSVVPGSRVLGGHYVPLIGRNSRGNYWCITWGRIHALTPEFIATYADEVIAYLSIDHLNEKGLSRRGFNMDKLKEYLAAL